MKHRGLERIADEIILSAIARAPHDRYVVWDGSPCKTQSNSLCSRALSCFHEARAPVPLRQLLQRAAKFSGDLGLDPDTVRRAVHQHQSARPASYLLIRRTPAGEYVAVTDIPWPAAAPGPLRAGDLVLDRHGNPVAGHGAQAAA